MCKEDWCLLYIPKIHIGGGHTVWLSAIPTLQKGDGKQRQENLDAYTSVGTTLEQKVPRNFVLNKVECIDQHSRLSSVFHMSMVSPKSHISILTCTHNIHIHWHTLSHTLRRTQRNAQCAKGDECCTISLG